jgi:transcriptional regulator with XRE-family HTH domain
MTWYFGHQSSREGTMADSDTIRAARTALGTELAALRQSAGHTQHSLARLVYTSRSSLANIETGYQQAGLAFWQRADEVLAAGGSLVKGFELMEVARRDQHKLQAHAASVARQSEVDAQRTAPQVEAVDLIARLTFLDRTCLDRASDRSSGREGTGGRDSPSFVGTSSPIPLALSGEGSASDSLNLPEGYCHVISSTGEVVVVAIDRRTFLTGAGLLLPAAALELVRHDVHGRVVDGRSTADVSEWREIVWEHGLSYMNIPAVQLLPTLQVDLLALQETLRRSLDDSVQRELRRVAALLAAITAQTVANLGDVRSSRRWWRTAKQAADESGDIEARVWIRGREVVRSLYEQRPIPVILDLVDEAGQLSLSGQPPPAALPQLLCGKAQALAHTGQTTLAESALCEVRDNLDSLPARTTCDKESLFGWSEHNVRFTESYVYSHLGDYDSADRAQTSALALYSETNVRGPAQIELQRALCLVRSGHVAPGVEHAHTVMTGLPREQHIRPIVDLGRTVLRAIPAPQQHKTTVESFRAYLASNDTA